MAELYPKLDIAADGFGGWLRDWLTFTGSLERGFKIVSRSREAYLAEIGVFIVNPAFVQQLATRSVKENFRRYSCAELLRENMLRVEQVLAPITVLLRVLLNICCRNARVNANERKAYLFGRI